MFDFCVILCYDGFDSCAAVYDRPFVAQSDGVAVRSFGDIAKDVKHPIGAHPEHYMLFRVGSFNDGTGEIVPVVPFCVCKAHELVAVVDSFGSGIHAVGDSDAS